MAFTFEITHISKLARAHLGVLDGKLLAGAVTTGADAKLIHGAQHLPLRIKGVALDDARRHGGQLSVTVDLRQHAMLVASVGDKLVAD